VKEEIAIIGMACRFPRALNIEAYWNLLVGGIEAVADPPPNRRELEPPAWLVDQAPTSRRGGFLDDLDSFEPGFFRISPREAARLDPQQRLLLEVAWEALEDAGQPIARLAGTSTGVFVGIMNADFARRVARDPARIDAQLGPGCALGIAPNRISFVLDLRGPSMAIDTLCSSSLVALHQACQSLLSDESSPVAIAAGVNAILDRTMDVFYARAGLLSKDARCRAFDAGATGIVRGEGCGVLVLKKLSRALTDGDRIYAVIRGSAVNQDGRSNGVTSPSRWSQEAVLRMACERAGVAPAEVTYVEAHGTGTLIGDPIETAALGAVIGKGRNTPCAIGSVKSNLGHLESAAGIASVIKTVLALQRAILPPSLHFKQANPYLHLEERGLRVVTESEPWKDERIAGVSSFGMGGTNSHIVLAAFEPPASRPTRDRTVVIPISARTPAALDMLETRSIEQLAHCRAVDLAYSLGVRRDHHDHRAAIVVAGGKRLFAVTGSVLPGRTWRVVFVIDDHTAESVARLRGIGVAPDELVHPAALCASLGENATVIVELASLGEELRRLVEAPHIMVTLPDELDPETRFLHLVGQLYCLGIRIDWARLAAVEARFVPIGTYPWQRERCESLFETVEEQAPGVDLLVPCWLLAEPASTCTREGDWYVFGDDALRGALSRAGRRLGELETATNVVVACGAELAPVVRVVQQLGPRSDVRLWLVTQGACAVDGCESLDGLAASPSWGFGRVVMNEYPKLRCRAIDVVGSHDDLIRELDANDEEREVALRHGKRYVARLTQSKSMPARMQCDAEGAYLITGGLGGLGLAAARLLIARGARRLVLSSRRGAATDEARRVVAKLAESGCDVIVERVDVVDRVALEGLFRRHRVRGVIHAAGVMAPAMISCIDIERIEEAVAAKVAGARNLHELTREHPLDFFVLYSSVAALIGMPGQAIYAAANSYLDSLALHRRALGLPATSIAWTVIEDTGMAESAGEKALGQLRDRGVEPMTITRATDVLEQLIVEAPSHVGVVNFDVARWIRFYPHVATMPRFAPQRPTVERSTPLETRTTLEALRDVIAAVLHDDAIDLDRPLIDLGLDSLTTLELQASLQAELGFEVSSEQLLSSRSLRELERSLTVPVTLETFSPRCDAVLDPGLEFAQTVRRVPREILLTGATGFLGAFVLAELLEHSEATINCLIRAATPEEGMRRLEITLGRYGLPAMKLTSRVRCIPGDLTKPRLGIRQPIDAIDMIIHSGAAVNFVYPYAALKADNVDGTREILRLAAVNGARLHYVSTIGVFQAARCRDPIFETERPNNPEHLTLGYMRAKWVAEELVAQARDRGLEVSIYRPGTISGHSRTGVFNPDDFVCVLLKGCIQLGLAPRVDVPLHLAPVDYVSRALVSLALGARPATYHLVGTQPISWLQLVDQVRRLGYPLAEVPYHKWRDVVRERAVATGNALSSLVPLFVEHDDTEWLQLRTYDDAAARAALPADVSCPVIDDCIVQKYVDSFVVSGYLPRPRK
jgi:thioester reductase-like protein